MLVLAVTPESLASVQAALTDPAIRRGPLFTKLAADLQRSIKKNFRMGGRPKWPISRRVQNDGGRITLNKSAALVNSIFRRNTNDEAVVFTRNPYAAIHQFGGVIRPKNAKALTIPIAPEAEGKRASDFPRKQTLLLLREGKAPLIVLKMPDNTIKPLFVLLKSVRIPARPFMEPPPEDLPLFLKRVIEYFTPQLGGTRYRD